MIDFIQEFRDEYRKQSGAVEKALEGMSDAHFFHAPNGKTNSIALIMKHVAGNLKSRWTDFLSTDGEKPDRKRDHEFVVEPGDSRDTIFAKWQRSFELVDTTLASLTNEHLTVVVTIRNVPHTVFQAILRNLNHLSYHVGQVLLLRRMATPDASWLTMPLVEIPSTKSNG